MSLLGGRSSYQLRSKAHATRMAASRAGALGDVHLCDRGIQGRKAIVQSEQAHGKAASLLEPSANVPGVTLKVQPYMR